MPFFPYLTISSFFEAEGDFEENLDETRPAPSWIEDEEEID